MYNVTDKKIITLMVQVQQLIKSALYLFSLCQKWHKKATKYILKNFNVKML